jgi:hypothetical protein
MNKIMRRFLAILFLLSIFVVFSSCNRSDPQVPRKESESKITDSDVEIINSIKECVVQIWVGQEDLSLEAKGTGFFVSKDGVFITAAHVVIEESTGQFYPEVRCFYGKRMFPVDLIAKELVIEYEGEPLEYDAVVYKVRDTNDEVQFPFLKVGNSLDANMGDEVYILGYAISGIFYKWQKMLNKIDPASRIRPYLKKDHIGAVMPLMINKTGFENLYVVDSYSVGGLSGSPIYHLKTNSVIGLVSRSPVASATLGDGSTITYPSGVLEVTPINYVKYHLMKINIVEKDEVWGIFEKIIQR